MVYIRTKKINDNLYAYLVESFKTKKGSRQKVKQYLGRVYKIDSKNYSNDVNVRGRDRNSFLLRMILPEFLVLGFKEKNNDEYIYKNFIFNSKKFSLVKKTKSKTLKDAIISLNNGYLCTFTLQRLIDFKKTNDIRKDAKLLAKMFLETGIEISQEDFISFYQIG